MPTPGSRGAGSCADELAHSPKKVIRMLWYTIRRMLQMIPVFLGATLLLYSMVFQLPGDPIAALAGDSRSSGCVQNQLRERYHLDVHFYQQYLLYLKGIFTLDFGTSFSGRPVSEVMAAGISRSRSNWPSWH